MNNIIQKHTESMENNLSRERLQKDVTELSNVKYDDLPSEEKWLIIQNECIEYYD